MTNRILFFICFSAAGIFAQQANQKVYLNTYVIPSDSNYNCYVTYKVPYRNLVFTKNDNSFVGGLSFIIEVSSGDSVIANRSTDQLIKLDEYDETNSGNEYLEGLISLPLDTGKYEIQPVIKVLNTDNEYRLKNVDLKIDSTSTGSFIKPLVTYSNRFECGNTENPRLYNSDDVIPYSSVNYDLLIPVADTAFKYIDVEIHVRDSTIFSKRINKYYRYGLVLEKCNGAVIAVNKPGSILFNIFELNNFTNRLDEGIIDLKISHGEKQKKYNLNVVWVNKPRALYNIEFAIDLLSIIGEGSIIESIKDLGEERYYLGLKEFWKKYDPDPATPFNELMYEFYRRVDYAEKNFSALGDSEGVFSDRGKIYIKYGEPTKIERKYSEKNDILEIWEYSKINKTFIFSDKTGVGNFELIE